ncbi:MAG: ADP-ribosylation/crystallin [Actinomycetia bacterium]|nr:ADP-ribosylation/crystallin [Actinomycetes bacterium]
MPTGNMAPVESRGRARGALYGLAIGDALGMPTQLLTRAEVTGRWGPRLAGFEPAPPGHPLADGMPAGSVTDDTEQAVLLARLLISGHGEIDPQEWASALVDWERDMAARGSLDLLGPSTKRAVAALLAGAAPEEAGLGGTTNGAAMRVTPVGIAFPLGYAISDSATSDSSISDSSMEVLLAHVRQASLITHNTPVAMAGAAAIAAAVSAGVDGAQVPAAIEYAIAAARLVDAQLADRIGQTAAASQSVGLAAGRRSDAAVQSGGAVPFGTDIAARITWAAAEARSRSAESVIDFIAGQVGTSLSTVESVPAAFAVLAAVPDDPWQACLLAASLGGDSDTIAAMAGAVAGACHGVSAFPAPAIATIDAHGLDLARLADSLCGLRG